MFLHTEKSALQLNEERPQIDHEKICEVGKIRIKRKRSFSIGCVVKKSNEWDKYHKRIGGGILQKERKYSTPHKYGGGR